MRLPAALLLASFAALPAAAQEVVPRTDDDLDRQIREAEAEGLEGKEARSIERILKICDDPETADVFLGNLTRTLRGAHAAARDLAVFLAASSPAFREAWEGTARARWERLRATADRAAIERLASRFRGTKAAHEALRWLARLAWEEGDGARTARLFEKSGGRLTAEEAALVAVARRAAGLGPSPAEWAWRWRETGAAGLRPQIFDLFPPGDSPLVARGEGTTLRAVLARLSAAPPDPWRGALNSSRLPFPPIRSLQPPPKTVRIFTGIGVPLAGPDAGAVRFYDPGAWDNGSSLRLLPWGGEAWACAGGAAVPVGRFSRGDWEYPLERELTPPMFAESPATDGRRLFVLAPDPRARNGQGWRAVVAFERGPDGLQPVWSTVPPAGRDTDDSADPFDRAWFTGPPVVSGGRLYVPAALLDSAYVPAIVCLDAQTGLRLWATALGEVTRRFSSTSILISASPPLVDGDRVFICTNAGIAAALDAMTGDPEWIHVYEREPGGGWTDAPPCAVGDRVLFCPLDTPKASLLDARNGLLIRSYRARGDPEGSYSWALGNGQMIALAGRTAEPEGEPRGLVKFLNLSGGRDVTYELPDPPAGRPAILDTAIAVPTAREICILNSHSGRLDVLHEWKNASEAGDLVRLPGWLAVIRGGEIRFWKAGE